MNARIQTPNQLQRTLTTVFTSGNSQAVRLPKEFRFNTKQVTIERRGDEVVLREKKRSLGQSLREALQDIAPLSDQEAREMDKALVAIRDQGTLEERAMWADPQFWGKASEAKPARAGKSSKAALANGKAKAGRP